MVDWFEMARECLPIGVSITDDIVPTPARSRYTPGGRVIHLNSCYRYEVYGECDDCGGRWVSLEVADRSRDRVMLALTEGVIAARMRGYGEFDPTQVPSLRSITTSKDRDRVWSLVDSVKHDDQYRLTTSHAPSVTDGDRPVLLILVEIIFGLTTAYLEFMWRDGRLELTTAVNPPRNCYNNYYLTDAGYFDGYVDSGDAVVKLNGREIVRRPTSGSHVMFSYRMGLLGVVATTREDDFAIFPPHTGAQPSRDPLGVHLHPFPRRVRGCISDGHLVQMTDDFVRVEELQSGRVNQWRNWALVLNRCRVNPSLHYDAYHRWVIYVDHCEVIIYGKRVFTRIRLCGDLTIINAQWLPWRSTLALFVGIQYPPPNQPRASSRLMIPLRLKYADQSAPTWVDVPLVGLTANLQITTKTRN